MAEEKDHQRKGDEILGRLDERTENIKHDISEIKKNMDAMQETFVTKKEFEPIRAFVFGIVTVICVGVFGGLMALIIKAH